jgi:hypothetical protein
MCDVEAGLGVLIFVYKGLYGQKDQKNLVDGVEGTLEWIPIDRIQTLNIVEDMRVIIPRVFKWSAGDEPFSATNKYNRTGKLVTTFFE